MGRWATRFAVVASVVVSWTASAHPGHGPEAGARHYLSDPYHLLAAAVGLAAGVSLVVLVRRLSRQLRQDD